MKQRPPHLLFITSLVADGKPSTGYEVANQAIIDSLRRLGARITVIGFARPDTEVAPGTITLGEIDPATQNASLPRKMQWLLRAATANVPVSVAKLRIISDSQLRAALDAAGPADACILNAVQMSAAFERVLTGSRYFYVAHNVEFHSASENADAAQSPLLRLLYRRESRLLQKIEDRLCRKAQFVFTLAEEDRAPLGVADASRSAVLPLVTTDLAPVGPTPRKTDCDAVLIGTWTWQPNLIGLDWFLAKVLPHLPQDFSIRIAGSIPEDLPARYPRVDFVGRVPDATAFVRSGRVVPLISRAGTGVQLKTIETFELGLSSVATPHSLRGIAEPPANCTVAEDPAEFAAALIRAANSDARDIDGSEFHRRQKERLDLALSRAFNAAGIRLSMAMP